MYAKTILPLCLFVAVTHAAPTFGYLGLLTKEILDILDHPTNDAATKKDHQISKVRVVREASLDDSYYSCSCDDTIAVYNTLIDISSVPLFPLVQLFRAVNIIDDFAEGREIDDRNPFRIPNDCYCSRDESKNEVIPKRAFEELKAAREAKEKLLVKAKEEKVKVLEEKAKEILPKNVAT